MLQGNEVVITERSAVSDEYFRRGVYRYVWTPEDINIRDRIIISAGAKVLPSGMLIELFDIPIPYYDSDILEDERENADIAIANRNSPTGGAKFKPKTSFAIVSELIENYAVRGLVHLECLSTTTPEGRKAAALVEQRLKLDTLADRKAYPTLMSAREALQKSNLVGVPKGQECIEAITAGYNQAIDYRRAWARKREAEIQQGLKGKGGRVETFDEERLYAASVGIVLTDANVMVHEGTVAPVAGHSASDSIATKLLMEQNETLAEQNDELKARLDKMAADFQALVKDLGGKGK